MDKVIVRPVEPGELAAVAGLRWQWIVENDGAAPEGAERDAFVRHFVTWAEQNASSHRCMVLVNRGVGGVGGVRGVRGVVGGDLDGVPGGDLGIIGMAWLAVVHRVPTPNAPHRASGDLQCVYVVPEARDAGLGGRLITDVARETPYP